MDKQGIKKHWNEFEAWINGKKVEFYDGTKFIPCESPAWFEHQQYRVKSEVVHYEQINKDGVFSICGSKDKPTSISFPNDRSKVTCPGCIKKFKELLVHYVGDHVHNALCSDEVITEDKTFDKSEVTCPDCLAKMKESELPEWVKVGAKCFTFSGALVEITKPINNELVEVLYAVDEGLIENYKTSRKISTLTPAVFRTPINSLLSLSPLAMCVKNLNLLITIAVPPPDGSAVGEWVKAT